jgi:hypothetical protein
VKSFREGLKVFNVWRRGNRASQFLELGVFAVDGQKGLIMLLEGRRGRGWSCRYAVVCSGALCGGQSSIEDKDDDGTF